MAVTSWQCVWDLRALDQELLLLLIYCNGMMVGATQLICSIAILLE